MKKGFLLLAVGVLGVSGCSGPSIVGKWSGMAPSQLGTSPATLDLKAEGKFEFATLMDRAPKPYTLTMFGTYKFEEDILTLTATDSKAKATNQADQAALDEYVSVGKNLVIAAMNLDGIWKITWNGGREMRATTKYVDIVWKKL